MPYAHFLPPRRSLRPPDDGIKIIKIQKCGPMRTTRSSQLEIEEGHVFGGWCFNGSSAKVLYE